MKRDLEDDIDTYVKDIDHFLTSEAPHHLIEGEELCGKTSIARQIFLAASGSSIQALLMDGDEIHKSLQFETMLRKAFSEQSTGNFEIWSKQPNKIIIIDNFNHKISTNLLKFLREHFSRIVILMSTDEYLTYFKESNQITDFSLYAVRRLTLVKQEALIRKWFQLNQNTGLNGESLDIRIDQIEEKLNNIISQNQIVPRFPFYVLSILQTLEGFMPLNYEITAYGHCYQALILAQLLKKNIPVDEIDSCQKFLTELSYDIFSSSNPFDKKKYTEFTNKYAETYLLNKTTL